MNTMTDRVFRAFIVSVPILIALYARRYEKADFLKQFPDHPANLNLPLEEFFDFIVVGGGTSGLVVSRRLSDAGFSVLVLEAGGDPPPLQAFPPTFKYSYSLPDINFVYSTVPQENVALETGRVLKVTTGRMVGGSSSHNGMLYERGSPFGWNEMADIVGDPSWRYEYILKYFKKAENYLGQFKDNGAHNVGGQMTVSQSKYAPGREIWLTAGRELNYPSPHDPNGPLAVGFGPCEFNTKFGRRESTFTAYIQGVEQNRENLKIRRYANASKIIIEKREAKSVIYTHHGIPRVARATKEIILSAGTFVSPLLLIKSGIGPKDQLKLANVTPILINENVGRNLMDHVIANSPPIFVRDPPDAWKLDQNITEQDFSNYLKFGDGPLSPSCSQAFFASNRAREEGNPEWPDVEVLFYQNQLNTMEKLFPPFIQGGGKNTLPPLTLACPIFLTRPRSRGTLTLNGNSIGIFDPPIPVIDFQFFQDESDFDVLIYGLEMCRKIVSSTEAFKKIGAKMDDRPIAACKNSGKFRSREYYKCYIRQIATHAAHSSGTAQMGKWDDEKSVVDSKFRVIGIDRLRIVDASIFPKIVNANTAASCVAIGEKAADDIIYQYAQPN